MTNSEKTLSAVREFAGTVLTAKEIQALTLAKYPEVNLGSILPSDYQIGSKYSTLQFLQKTATGNYRVVDAVRVASVRGNRGQSLTDALASALAKLPKVSAEPSDATEPSDAELEALTAPTN